MQDASPRPVLLNYKTAIFGMAQSKRDSSFTELQRLFSIANEMQDQHRMFFTVNKELTISKYSFQIILKLQKIKYHNK